MALPKVCIIGAGCSGFATAKRLKDHGSPFDSHAAGSGEFLLRAGSGDPTMKGGVERLDRDGVVFSDGNCEAIDVIVWTTGHDIRMPGFKDPAFAADADNRLPPLYKRIMKPGVPDPLCVGLAQPLPTPVNFAEQRSTLVAAYLAGQYLPPDSAEMERTIAADEQYDTGQYDAARRHTIQLDFDRNVRAFGKKPAKGAVRARAKSNALPVRPRELEDA